MYHTYPFACMRMIMLLQCERVCVYADDNERIRVGAYTVAYKNDTDLWYKLLTEGVGRFQFLPMLCYRPGSKLISVNPKPKADV